MKILAVETSTEVCSLAYVCDGEMIGVAEETIPRKHAERIPEFFNRLKNETGLKLPELDGIAVSIGPGSFTGLRVGLSYAKGLAFSHSLPIVTVPTLLALAAHSAENCHECMVLLFSHRDIIYRQLISCGDGEIKSIDGAKAVTWTELEQDLNTAGPVFHWGCGKFLYGIGKEVKPSASAVGILAEQNFKGWVNHEPFQLVPEYISPFETGTRKND